jgi:hypothetical protein
LILSSLITSWPDLTENVVGFIDDNLISGTNTAGIDKMNRLDFLAFLLFLVQLVELVCSWNAVLRVSNLESRAVAGESFLTQPKVSVTSKSGDLQLSFQGTVHVKLSHSTERNELLCRMSNVDEVGEYGGSSVWNSVKVGVYSMPIVRGEAQFSHLYVNKAADGYRLKFLLTDSEGKSVATTFSEAFSVVVGEPYQIGIVNSPSTVLGGVPFQFLIVVQDKGFNTIRFANHGTVSVIFTFLFNYYIVQPYYNKRISLPSGNG